MRTAYSPQTWHVAVRRWLCLLFPLLPLSARAVLDTNNNGLSDLWERANNNGELFPDTADFLSAADPDGDGWTNEQEAAAGTNPFQANPPDGIVRTQLLRIPATYCLDENGDPELLTPETYCLTWPTLPGKQYLLSFSPDLTPENWTPVGEPFIATGTENSVFIPVTQPDGSIPERLFWHVAVSDTDSDGDGLTDHEEYLLGTNPNNPQTLPGYADLWLAANFTQLLLDRQLAMIDTDGDGLTNAQEAFLGTDPNVPDNPGILQEAIFNGDFSQPTIGTGEWSGTETPIDWDYWTSGVPGWTALDGQNIEYQIIDPIGEGNQYCELKAHPEGHNGIKQKFGTHKDVTYLLVLQCKAREDTPPADSNFDILIDGTSVLTVIFDSHGPWITRSVAFKATDVITELALSPAVAEGTCGCLVDNIRIASVAIADLTDPATGVDDVSITADKSDTGYQDKFWIMAPAGNDPNDTPCANRMKFKIPLNPTADLAISCPNAQATPSTVTLASSDPMSEWHGTASATSDESPTFTVGQDNDILPIGVKVMKRRTVNVVCYMVRTPGSTNYITICGAESLQTELNRTFGWQVNAWFNVVVKGPEVTVVDYDIDHDGWLRACKADLTISDEEQKIVDNVALDPSADIHVFYANRWIGTSETPPTTPGSEEQSGILGATPKDDNKVFLSPRAYPYGEAEITRVIAHEIGHVMLGPGHPDEGKGIAPLEGTDRTKRRMYSLSHRNEFSRLLV